MSNSPRTTVEIVVPHGYQSAEEFISDCGFELAARMSDASKTILIKIHVLANADGKWAAYGWTDSTKNDADEVLYDMMGDADIDTARAYVVTAEIPLPQIERVIGVVGEVSESDSSYCDRSGGT